MIFQNQDSLKQKIEINLSLILRFHIFIFIFVNSSLFYINIMLISIFSTMFLLLFPIFWIFGLISHGYFNKKKKLSLKEKLANSTKTSEKLDLSPIPMERARMKRQALLRSSNQSSEVIREKMIKAKPKKTKQSKGMTIRKLSKEDIKELRETESEVEIQESKIICIVHKGIIGGANIYICPHCKSFYCAKCIKALQKNGEKCWSCNKDFILPEN